MNFSSWAIKNPIAPILGFFLLMVLGWNSFNTLPITRFPNIDVPLVGITVVQPGAAPAEMESQVTKEIEDAVAGINGVKNVNSTVNDGISTTVVEYRMEVPTEKAVQDTKDAIDQIRGNLPASIEAPIVTRIDVEGQAIMTFAVTAPDKTLEELSWFVDDVITRGLQGRPGIGRVSRFGGADREIRVELDPVRLDSFGISASAVNQQLRATNANLGSGRSELGSGEQAIRTLGDAATVDRLADTTIALPSGRKVRLSDLGEVIDSYEELRSFSSLNGNRVVSFAVYRASGASEVSVAETVNAQLDVIRANNSEVGIELVDETVFYTYGNYESALHTLIEGAILAILVVLAFLKNWRATIIAAVALPLSAVPTFFIMDLLGFSLNLVSFLALTLATGILVDDAIVEIENIARHIRMGKTPFRAAIEAADEIGLAVVATTFTIVAVFVPVSFMPGIPGQYFRQFGMTVAIAVIFSLIVARLITPMMAAYLMRDKDGHEDSHNDGWIMTGYLRLIRTSLRFRYVTLLSAIGVLVVSVYYMLQIPGSFLPPEDVSRIAVSVELPPGTTLDETERTTKAIYTAIEDLDWIDNVFILGGASPTGDRDIRRASVTILLTRLDHSLLLKLSQIGRTVPVIGGLVPEVENKGRTVPQNIIEESVFTRLQAVPDMRAFKLNDRGQRDISFSILSSNEADLNLAVSRLETALSGDPLLANVASEGALPRPEIQITPRMDEAARLGITTAQIADVVRVATIGDVDAALAKLSIDNRLVPVRVRLNNAAREDLARISALKLTTATGSVVPLSAVADVAIAEGPSTVNRLNRERRATIGANLPVGVALGTATDRFTEIVATVELPPGVRVQEAGDAEVQNELMASFGNAMLLGLMLVLTVLILLFKSVIQPFTILFSLPLAIGGVATALILTGSAVSMPVLIGILMLMGIVTKNAILLIDFAIEMRAQGMERFTAVMEAGHKRARPIVMTSIAMSAGMLPSALGVGEGGSFRAPMATAVIGGIIVSTVLSLVVVPAFYLIMDDLSRVLGWAFGRFVGKKEPDPEAPPAEVLAERIALLDAEQRALRDRLDAMVGPRTAPPLAAAE
ncbi:MAG: efflux RND transporter permease subunit [Pseudotabrizicola sp.]|uniref:efflux RND transporter permease subunit n=1 Tax=Pseudotabrizicola sp. TaxID=2939647 RepID=UPI00272FFC6F|nr:efflux RND transporter permease subunit [Pseudotabrizicola sp.]MDP2081234.1 efflux RND transporter permease subunit [Pseudotabrizicola sp.]MDZ7576147.1 efflux RND transporter permease subunit [Pseudotabrizicola sp.]